MFTKAVRIPSRGPPMPSGGNRRQTVEALTVALPRLQDAGYTFTHP